MHTYILFQTKSIAYQVTDEERQTDRQTDRETNILKFSRSVWPCGDLDHLSWEGHLCAMGNISTRFENYMTCHSRTMGSSRTDRQTLRRLVSGHNVAL